MTEWDSQLLSPLVIKITRDVINSGLCLPVVILAQEFFLVSCRHKVRAMTKETMSKTPPTVPDLPSCLTADGKWVVLDSDEASDTRFKKVAKFNLRFPNMPVGLLLLQTMEKNTRCRG